MTAMALVIQSNFDASDRAATQIFESLVQEGKLYQAENRVIRNLGSC